LKSVRAVCGVGSSAKRYRVPRRIALVGLALSFQNSSRTTDRIPIRLLWAADYALSNWSQLGVYLEDGRPEVDNNLIENRIRPAAIGKKNWLFFGGADAGQRSAILYTIVECCRRRGLDPLAYLRDVLSRLPAIPTGRSKTLLRKPGLKPIPACTFVPPLSL
jgi:hypothetical protein